MFTFSIIIPVKTKADLCPELLPALDSQTLSPLETFIVTDSLCPGDPATKRDFGARQAHGSVLAFLDGDAYPTNNWLQTANRLLASASLAAVCGPGLTPVSDPPLAQLSGLFWSTFLGAGLYRFRSSPAPSRLVDDYPSFNLLVKTASFRQVGGFATSAWPGEDTKLCLELTHSLKKQILYHPKVLVYHHRRQVIFPHLRQLSRYGAQRGSFVRLYPKTSRRLFYFLPLFFLLFLPLTWPLYLLSFFLLSLPLVFPLLERLPRFLFQLFFLAPTFALSHLTYSLFFFFGLFVSNSQR